MGNCGCDIKEISTVKTYTVKGTTGEKGDAGAGVATGGTTGQVLTKKTNTNFDTEWTALPAPIFKRTSGVVETFNSQDRLFLTSTQPNTHVFEANQSGTNSYAVIAAGFAGAGGIIASSNDNIAADLRVQGSQPALVVNHNTSVTTGDIATFSQNSGVVVNITKAGAVIVQGNDGTPKSVVRNVDLTNAFVPYAGATTNLNMGNYGITAAGQSFLSLAFITNLKLNIQSTTSNYTVGATEHTILASTPTGNITITLPSVAANSGRVLIIKKTDSNGNAVVISAGPSTIDGLVSKAISVQYESLTLQCDGSLWFVTAKV